MQVIPSGACIGARVTGVDLAQPLDDGRRNAILESLARHGVLCFPGQALEPARLRAFAARFGSLEVNVASGSFQAGGLPEVMVLSNVVEDGRPIGLADAGQGWHTDMSYSATVALATVLHALEVPRDERGEPLGATRFASMTAAWDGLPEDLKARLEGATAVHDFAKFWDMMRRREGSTRPPLSADQRRRKPPVSHPVCLVHPVSGRKVLYANPGYVVRIEGLPPAESDALLETLFRHQLRPEYRFVHRWSEGDVLMWDDIATLHDAVADYGPDRRRRMHRCQVMADRVFATARESATA